MSKRPLVLPLLIALAACGDGPASASRDGGDTPTEAAIGKASLDADGLPLFRAGLWEHVERRGDEVETRRECRAAGLDKASRDLLVGPVRAECTRVRGGSGAGLTVSVQCKVGDLTTGTTIRLSGDETHARSSMVMSVTGADGVPARESVEGESRWLSPCPEGMAVGDEAPMDEPPVAP